MLLPSALFATRDDSAQHWKCLAIGFRHSTRATPRRASLPTCRQQSTSLGRGGRRTQAEQSGVAEWVICLPPHRALVCQLLARTAPLDVGVRHTSADQRGRMMRPRAHRRLSEGTPNGRLPPACPHPHIWECGPLSTPLILPAPVPPLFVVACVVRGARSASRRNALRSAATGSAAPPSLPLVPLASNATGESQAAVNNASTCPPYHTSMASDPTTHHLPAAFTCSPNERHLAALSQPPSHANAPPAIYSARLRSCLSPAALHART